MVELPLVASNWIPSNPTYEDTKKFYSLDDAVIYAMDKSNGSYVSEIISVINKSLGTEDRYRINNDRILELVIE